jgi:hypothetical protein
MCKLDISPLYLWIHSQSMLTDLHRLMRYWKALSRCGSNRLGKSSYSDFRMCVERSPHGPRICSHPESEPRGNSTRKAFAVFQPPLATVFKVLRCRLQQARTLTRLNILHPRLLHSLRLTRLRPEVLPPQAVQSTHTKDENVISRQLMLNGSPRLFLIQETGSPKRSPLLSLGSQHRTKCQ